MPYTIHVKVRILSDERYSYETIEPVSVTLVEDDAAKPLSYIATLVEEQLPVKVLGVLGNRLRLVADDEPAEYQSGNLARATALFCPPGGASEHDCQLSLPPRFVTELQRSPCRVLLVSNSTPDLSPQLHSAWMTPWAHMQQSKQPKAEAAASASASPAFRIPLFRRPSKLS